MFAQRFNANGVAQGSEFRVNSTTANPQSNPAVAMDANGNFVVAWTSVGQDGSGDGVYAQRFNAAGVAPGRRVPRQYLYDGKSARSAHRDERKRQLRHRLGQHWSRRQRTEGVYAQRYNAAGATQGSEFRVNVTTAGDQWADSAAMDAAGNFIVAFSSSDGSGLGVYTRRYDAAGNPLTGEVPVNTTTAGDQTWDQRGDERQRRVRGFLEQRRSGRRRRWESTRNGSTLTASRKARSFASTAPPRAIRRPPPSASTRRATS